MKKIWVQKVNSTSIVLDKLGRQYPNTAFETEYTMHVRRLIKEKALKKVVVKTKGEK